MGAFKIYNTTTSQWEYAKVLPANSTLVNGATVAGAVNGSNTTFTTPTSFVFINVYKNGVRMRQGAGNDYVTSGNNTIVFATAPATGSIITVDYGTQQEQMINGSNSMLSDEVPTGSVNGTNAVFTTYRPYIAGTLQVFINGVKQARTTHFTETNPGAGTFTMGDAPLTGDNIIVNYQFIASVAGNADTIDGIHASTTATANMLMPLDANGKVNANLLFNPVKFSAYRSAALSPTASTPIAFDTVLYDTGSNYSTSTGLFTAPYAGYYTFNAQAGINQYASGNYYWLSVRKNNNEWRRLARNTSPAQGNYYPGGSFDMYLVQGDTVGVTLVGGAATSLETGSLINFFEGKLTSIS